MRILLVHQYFKTPDDGGGIRSYHIAKYLAAKGHEVFIITAYNEPEEKEVFMEGFTVRYLPVYYSNHLGFLARLHAFGQFVLRAVKYLGNYNCELNYVITTPLSTSLIALYARLRYKTPYILEVGDLWPDAPIDLGVLKNVFLKKIAFWLETTAYKKAQTIVALSPDIKESIERKVKGKQVETITNMSDVHFLQPSETSSEKLVVAYTGTIGLANNLEYLVEAAALCQNLPIEFIVLGSGARKERIIQLTRERNITNLTFINPGGMDKVKQVMSNCDAIYISFKKVKTLQAGSPNKFFDALAGGKMVIVNFRGWLKEEVEKNSLGFYYDPDNPIEFKTNLIEYINNPEKLKKAKSSARQLAESKYSVLQQLKKLDSIIK